MKSERNERVERSGLQRITRRDLLGRTAGAAAAFSMAELLAACTPSATPSAAASGAASPTAKKGGTLVEANPNGIQNLNPLFAGREQAGAAVGSLMFDRLYSSTINGEPIPLLAAELPSASSDLKTIT